MRQYLAGVLMASALVGVLWVVSAWWTCADLGGAFLWGSVRCVALECLR